MEQLANLVKEGLQTQKELLTKFIETNQAQQAQNYVQNYAQNFPRLIPPTNPQRLGQVLGNRV